MKNIWKYLLVLLIGIGIGVLINIPSCKKTNTITYIPVHDTITINSVRIQEKTVYKHIKNIDTFYVNQTDTIFLKNFPIEHKEYKDTFNTDSTKTSIKINYHGFNSNIDSVRIGYNYLQKNEIITPKEKKFGLGVTVGPYIGYGINATPNGQFNHGFEVGIGVMVGLNYKIK